MIYNRNCRLSVCYEFVEHVTSIMQLKLTIMSYKSWGRECKPGFFKVSDVGKAGKDISVRLGSSYLDINVKV